MTTRRRIKNAYSTISGFAYHVPRKTKYLAYAYPGHYWITDDVVGHFDLDNGLVVDKRLRRVPVFNGDVMDYTVNPPVVKVQVVNLGPIVIGGFTAEDPRSQFVKPDFLVWAPRWFGSMVPGQSRVNLPAIIGEGKELPSLVTQIPHLIRDWGAVRFGKNAGRAERAAAVAREAARTLGSTNLWYRFGLSPTIADALSMLGLLDSFLEKLEDLMRLKCGESLHRSLRLSPDRRQYDDGILITHSAGITLKHRKIRVFKMNHWVTTRWVPVIPALFHFASQRHLIAMAISQTTGFSIGGLATAWWELLPWSWLVDWIARVQGLLGLLGSLDLPLKCESFCYMRTSFTDTYWPLYEKPVGVVGVGDGYVNRTIKERIPLAIQSWSGPVPSVPTFSGGQLGILGSLLATRGF